MPRLVPERPLFGAKNKAERSVWEALRDQLPDDAALFHGVRLQEFRNEHEADIVVALPGAGWAVIEVKGGKIRHQGAQWQQYQRTGWEAIDPIGQAQDCRHVLERMLRRNGAGPAANARAIHMIAFPDAEVPGNFNRFDCPRDMILDKHDLQDVLRRVRSAIDDIGQGHTPLSDDGCALMADVVSGPSFPQADLLALDDDHAVRIAELTEMQNQVLDLFTNHHRMAVIGGAGTGKTWLALEQAHRLTKQGQRVALVCYSRGLAHFFVRMVRQWPAKEQPWFVGLFHDLPMLWGAPKGEDDDSHWWEEELPALLGDLAAKRSVDERFDSIVVDEGQDFSASWWPPTLQALKDPEHGGLYVFADEGQRVFARDGRAPIELAPFTLQRNIRNTKRIAQVFGALRTERMVHEGIDGPPVQFMPCRTEDAVECADDAVVRLTEEEGWPTGMVALLTTEHRHPVQRDIVRDEGWDAYWDEYFAGEQVFYGHVLGFKGLERAAVVLAVNGFRDPARAREMLYVGLSRARTLLVVCGDLELIRSVGGEGLATRLERASPPTGRPAP